MAQIVTIETNKVMTDTQLPILYGYFRSSAAYRVRLALNLKSIAYEHRTVHLLNQGGEQLLGDNLKRNPQALVPSLEIDGVVLSQSLAILDYLEETRSDIPLLPSDPVGRAQVRAFCQSIACEIHPLDNLRVLKYLVAEMGASDEQKLSWYRHWAEQGLRQTAALLASHTSGRETTYCYGDEPGLAECLLIPQLYNARRFNCDLTGLERLVEVDRLANALPAFMAAHPDSQPDAG